MRDAWYDLSKPVGYSLGLSLPDGRRADASAPLDADILRSAVESTLVRLCLAVAVAEAHGCGRLSCQLSHGQWREMGGSEGIRALEALVSAGTQNGMVVDFTGTSTGEAGAAVRAPFDSTDLGSGRLVLVSGGLDCRVALELCRDAGERVSGLFVDYGQTNVGEERACIEETVETWSEHYGTSLPVRELSARRFFSSFAFASGLLVSGEDMRLANATREYVPFRNSIFLALTLCEAERSGVESIVTGSHADDVTSPDNSREFYDLWNRWLRCGSARRPTVDPVLWNVGGKADVVALAQRLGVDLSSTWSCHNKSAAGGRRVQCGRCSECETRSRAFRAAGAIDPVPKIPPSS